MEMMRNQTGQRSEDNNERGLKVPPAKRNPEIKIVPVRGVRMRKKMLGSPSTLE